MRSQHSQVTFQPTQTHRRTPWTIPKLPEEKPPNSQPNLPPLLRPSQSPPKTYHFRPQHPSQILIRLKPNHVFLSHQLLLVSSLVKAAESTQISLAADDTTTGIASLDANQPPSCAAPRVHVPNNTQIHKSRAATSARRGWRGAACRRSWWLFDLVERTKSLLARLEMCDFGHTTSLCLGK